MPTNSLSLLFYDVLLIISSCR